MQLQLPPKWDCDIDKSWLRYLDSLVAVRLVTLEGSGALLHDGVLLKRSNHFLKTRRKSRKADQRSIPTAGPVNS